MEIEVTHGMIHLVLSRRNLRTLLLKLDRKDSERSIFKGGDLTHPSFAVTAEEDAEHYKGRQPGEMHPEEEAKLKEVA